jgi:thermitase
MGVRARQKHLTKIGGLALLLCVLALLVAAGSKEANALLADTLLPYEPAQVIVKLDPNTGATIGQINDTYLTTTRDATLGGMGIYLLQTPDKENPKAFLSRTDLTSDPRVLYAEPNFVVQTEDDARTDEDAGGDGRHRAWSISSASESSDQYPDKLLAKNLGLSPCAATQNNQGKGVIVAVLDTGAQLDHPDLKASLKNVKRYDFVDDDTNPSERWVGQDEDNDGDADEMTGHGTHVSGIVVRVAPAAKIMPLRVLDTEGYGDVFTISKAIRYAWLNGAKVINLSLGSSERSEALWEMIGTAIDKGVVVAAAAGNSDLAGTALPHYPAAGGDGIIPTTPASADGLVAVTSVGADLDKSDFANFGPWVDVAAPGEAIRSAFPISQYANWSGTSMSTPFVSGEAALIRSAYGSRIKPAGKQGIEAKIRDTARREDLLYSGLLGVNHVDVCASLSK